MKIKLAKIIALVALTLAGVCNLAIISNTYAYDVCKANNVSKEIKDASGCASTSGDKLPNLIQNIVSAVIGVSGLVSVVFVVVGGINYMTSGGDTNKVQKAKNTILYALIGMVICVLAFAIVNFVIAKIIK